MRLATTSATVASSGDSSPAFGNLAVDGTPSALSSLRTVGGVCRRAFPIRLLVRQDERHTATLGGCLEDGVDHAHSDRRVLEDRKSVV